MKKQLIIIGIIGMLFMISISGCFSPSTNGTITSSELVYGNYKPGDVVVLEDIYTGYKEVGVNNTYGEKYHSLASLNGMENHCVTFQSFSKTYAVIPIFLFKNFCFKFSCSKT